MKKALLVVLVVMTAAVRAPSPAAASADGNGWDFSVAPYLWGAGVDGSLTVRGHDFDVDKPFEEIFDDLDFGLMVNLQARRDRLGLFTDLTYLKISDTQEAQARGGAIVEATAETEQWLVDFGASWEVARWARCGQTVGFVDVLAGGRYWNVESEIKGDGSLYGPSGKVEKEMDWVDPVVGVRFMATLAPKLTLVGRADVGGFDIGDASDLTWSMSASLGWHFNDLVTGWFGWKHLSVEREDDRANEIDLDMSGPLLGVSFVF